MLLAIGIAPSHTSTTVLQKKLYADIELAAKLKPEDAYYALWREVATWVANKPSTLVQAASQIDMAKWPAPVVKFFLGEITQASLIDSATDIDRQKTRECLCEANFFVGRIALRRGAREDAKRAFKAALLDCPRQFLETGAAAAELKALER
jgi:lipoprotein NlpI